MTPRERYLQTLLFDHPERIPFSPGGPRQSTLARWRREGLDGDTAWPAAVSESIGIPPEAFAGPKPAPVDFRMIPWFEEKVLERRDGRLVVQDWKGNVCEISDQFDVTYLRNAIDFVTRRWIRCPVETREDWERMKERYDPDTPSRLADDIQTVCGRPDERTAAVTVSVSGPFWQMREWCGFEGLCMLMVEQPDWVDEMAAFWCEYVERMLQRVCERIVPDALMISEDMAYKAKAMISPAMTRRFCLPSWRRWTELVTAAGCPIVDMDSDGFIGELIPLWIEAGINACNPIEVAAGNDINDFRRRFKRAMAYRGSIDKRAIAAGGETILAELSRLEPVVRDGGFIPSCDHGVPSDISWPNFLHYARRLAEITGWR